VLPAWHILDLLDEPDLVSERRKDKAELDKRKKESAILDVQIVGVVAPRN
jgi:hypothetical protein